MSALLTELQKLITAAANAAGLPLTTWLVQAAREKLARESAPGFRVGKIENRLNKQK